MRSAAPLAAYLERFSLRDTRVATSNDGMDLRVSVSKTHGNHEKQLAGKVMVEVDYLC